MEKIKKARNQQKTKKIQNLQKIKVLKKQQIQKRTKKKPIKLINLKRKTKPRKIMIKKVSFYICFFSAEISHQELAYVSDHIILSNLPESISHFKNFQISLVLLETLMT